MVFFVVGEGFLMALRRTFLGTLGGTGTLLGSGVEDGCLGASL